MEEILKAICKKRGKSLEIIANELGYSYKELVLKANEASNIYMKLCVKLSVEPNDLWSEESIEICKVFKRKHDLDD